MCFVLWLLKCMLFLPLLPACEQLEGNSGEIHSQSLHRVCSKQKSDGS